MRSHHVFEEASDWRGKKHVPLSPCWISVSVIVCNAAQQSQVVRDDVMLRKPAWEVAKAEEEEQLMRVKVERIL